MSKTIKGVSPLSGQSKACEMCAKRSVGCHSGCEEYAKELIFGIVFKASVIKDSNARSEIKDYVRASRMKKHKTLHPSNRYRRTSLKRR